MREAVGGTLLFYFILGFLAIYIFFIGVIMNYAATYRASNYVVTALEETEGDVSKTTLVEELKSRHYYNGLTISCNTNLNGDAVYKVVTYVNFDIPLIDISIPLRIENETKAIYDVACKMNAVG